MTKAATSLYVHWPFCEAKCPYCDFNSHVRERIDAKAYEKALLDELYFFARESEAETLTSIFFGGGTPSLMPVETAAVIIETSRDLFRWEENIEITLEANPGSSEAKKFEGFRKAGVNRLSLGVQSLYDDALKFLGRVHNADEAKTAIGMAKNTFPRFSFDLIYARPGQTPVAWQEELEEALTLAGDHLSLYQLTLEKDTAFYRAAQRGKLVLPDENISADLFEFAGAFMEKAGRPRYEISNYAKPGQESRHNLNYWQGGQYMGIGPGAHGRYVKNDTWVATATLKSPEEWLRAVGEKGQGLEEATEVSALDRAQEIVMTALRLKEGVSNGMVQSATGIGLNEAVDFEVISALKDADLVSFDQNRIALTPKGVLLLDSIVSEILV